MVLSEHRPFLIKRYFSIFIYFALGAVVLFPCIAFVVVTQFPIYLYRLVVTKLLAPCFRPKIGKAVTVNAQFQATEFLDKSSSHKSSSHPSEYAIIGKFVVRRKVSFEEIKKLILARWVRSRTAGGELRYPEFQQYIGSWMGFMFWKQVESFDVDHHVTHHVHADQMDKDESDRFLDKLQEDILNKPFLPGHSPWEVYLINNYSTPELEEKDLSVILFRFHHALADGFALAHVVVEGLFDVSLEEAHMNIPTKIRGNKIISVNSLFSKMIFPFQLVRNFGFILSVAISKSSPWKHQRNLKVDLEAGKPRDTARQIFAKSLLIPVEKLKFMRRGFDVSLSSVLFSSLSASLAKSFHTATPTMAVENLKISIMLPTTGHEDKLRNHTHCAIFEIDTDPQVSSEQRLLEMERRFMEARRSPQLVSFLMRLFSASLATPFASIIKSSKWIPVGTSNFRGPEKSFGLDEGRSVLLLDSMLSPFTDLMVSMCSYNGGMRFAVTTRNDVMDKSQLEELVLGICQELENLYKMAQQIKTVSANN